MFCRACSWRCRNMQMSDDEYQHKDLKSLSWCWGPAGFLEVLLLPLLLPRGRRLCSESFPTCSSWPTGNTSSNNLNRTDFFRGWRWRTCFHDFLTRKGAFVFWLIVRTEEASSNRLSMVGFSATGEESFIQVASITDETDSMISRCPMINDDE